MEDYYLCKGHLLPTDSKEQDYGRDVNWVALLKKNMQMLTCMFLSYSVFEKTLRLQLCVAVTLLKC